ncbi:hypothetical protein AKJ09_10841 [Labilithrix luteola]|uniref:Uncharacterized protein n=1 Tax=Labilithrix luteola TaxID=1391654 RepID=A0A0K1QEL8_9BACT|nr:hypothetical protein [Labilithrix luteola]AKV04178.1 hypothetical protein AKJ09_10841 [Labilithrix luteola]
MTGTENLTSTAIGLIGIHRAGIEARDLGIDVAKTRKALLGLTRSRRYWGGFGLVLWANAVWDWMPVGSLQERCEMALCELPDRLSAMTTMQVAWLASGLLHEWKKRGNARTQDWSHLTLRELASRLMPESRLMRHASDRAPLTARLRQNVANFADQVYAIQTLAFAEIAFGGGTWLKRAVQLADRNVALQGPLGQWWWHFDARRGRVLQRYPVYAVHQHAMAPMALLAVTSAGGPSYENWIRRSQDWIHDNESSTSLVDRGAHTVWRDVEPRENALARRRRHARSLLGIEDVSSPRLAVNRETRPYEWAWCLYAGATASGPARKGHLR